ncbi:MAG: sigma-54 interaction domain-containing protein [Vicinamibacterales bacterium]
MAQSTGDPHLLSMALGGLVDCLFHFESFESGLAHLNGFKRAAIRSGRPDDLFTLRLLLAEAEHKAGRSHRAVRELELAELHAASAPSLEREARLRFIQGAVSIGLGHFAQAFQRTSEAVRLATEAGATTIEEPARNNLAHLQVVRCDFDRAAKNLAQLFHPRPQSIDVELLRRATQLQLAIETGDSTTAEELIGNHGADAMSRRSVHAHLFNVARATYLLRTGSYGAAHRIGDEILSRISGTYDRDLLDRTRLLVAETLARLDRTVESVTMLAEVALGPLGTVAEIAAGIDRVSAYVAGSGPEAAAHLSRASRLLHHIGHLAGARSTEGEAGVAVTPGNVAEFSAPQGFPWTGACLIASVSSVVSMGATPSFVAAEIVELVRGCMIGVRAVARAAGDGGTRLIAAFDNRDTLPSSADDVTLVIGEEEGVRYTVAVTPSNDTSARITLFALQRLVASARELHAARLAESERSALWPDPPPEQQLGFICASEVMLDLMRTTRRVAASPITVLITGETGTGKELLARAVHQCSTRSASRFVPFNCTAVARDLLESQLFGFRKGAFTGAHEASPGVIRGAAGGTLFLDEIGEIGLDVQPKLLRFLESSEVHPLGEPAPVTVDVRVVAATNADLDRLMAEGRFREDLFYRLNVVKLTIPPLRERREEIPLLLDHFLERTSREAGKTGIRIAESTSEFLLLYAWPGNVRELSNEVRRMVALAESGAVVMPEHLSPKIAATRRTVPVAERPLEPTELVVRRDQPLSAAVEHVERALIQDALRATSNVELAARRLGLSRKGLYLKRQRLKIDE